MEKGSVLKCIIAATTLASCGWVGKKSDDDVAGAGVRLDSNLLGTWERGCEKFDLLGTQYRKVRMDLNADSTFSREQTLFSDSNCAGERYVEKQTGSWNVVGDAKDGSDARQVNFTVKDAFVNPRNAQVATDFNNSKYCGVTEWKDGVDKKVTNIKCTSGLGEGQVIFDIYKVEDKKLYLGKTGFFLSGKSDSQRPTELDKTKAYDKK